MILEAKPAHTINQVKDKHRMQQIPKSMINVFFLSIYGDLKIDRKFQKATEVIYFLSYSQLANQKIDGSS